MRIWATALAHRGPLTAGGSRHEPWSAPTERQVMLSAERPREKNVAGQAAVGN